MPIICVECGQQVEDGKELFREFSGGSLQLTRCVSRSVVNTRPNVLNRNIKDHQKIMHLSI